MEDFKPHPSSCLRHDATLPAFGEGKDVSPYHKIIPNSKFHIS